MTIEHTTHHPTGTQTWAITINHHELTTLNLRPGDQRLLNECASPDATIADTILGLELIARRIEETNAHHQKP